MTNNNSYLVLTGEASNQRHIIIIKQNPDNGCISLLIYLEEILIYEVEICHDDFSTIVQILLSYSSLSFVNVFKVEKNLTVIFSLEDLVNIINNTKGVLTELDRIRLEKLLEDLLDGKISIERFFEVLETILNRPSNARIEELLRRLGLIE